ncbi:MAG: methyltransferase domain-containing protein [Deltaproteobacteria bacterium]|nr:methyltransferase domain-containing protein [Deltaproteobacteria bacterium]
MELALIRWLPGQVRVLAYFPNLILISAFLGLGIGCLRAKKRSLLWLWPLSLATLFGCFFALSHVVFTHDPESEQLWLLYFDLPRDAPVVEGVHLPIILAFILSAISFIPLGQFIAKRLNTFSKYSSSLWGYSWDILGSLLGVVGFAMVCFLQQFPVTWFAIVFVVGLVLFLPKKRLLLVYVPGALLCLGIVVLAEKAAYYSPYYSINTDRDPATSGEAGFFVMTNGSYHQKAISLRRAKETTSEWHRKLKHGYHLPFDQLKKPARRVLVLGAGTGNDVAVLLDHGAESIDAVEIDPLILEIGRKYHPDRPYDSPRVRTINTDARQHLNSCDEKYDLIVFGTLDSTTKLSALSNVRLDNFVYTLEGMQAACDCLTPDGGMVLYFAVAKNYIEDHLLGAIVSAFGQFPAGYSGEFGMFTRIYMLGPAFSHMRGDLVQYEEKFFNEILPTIEVPTDDWPYLYLRSRGVNNFYLSLMAIFAGLAVIGVFLVSREMRASVAKFSKIDFEMFLFGTAFLLIETKFITAMNLVWGATWLTSAVVFGSVLSMILLATIVMKLKPLRWWLAVAGLLLTLLATYFVPPHFLLCHNSLVKLVLSVFFVGMPVFFASACFALRFRDRAHVDLAFGWNLLGAVAGGLMEFFSMAVGLKALSLVAIAAYLGVVWLVFRRNP